MPPTVEDDRRREATRLRDQLPSRPLTRRDSEMLQADPNYEVYWVCGQFDGDGRKRVTRLADHFDYFHVIALDFDASTGTWNAVATGAWPADVRHIADALDSAASPTADWHVPLADAT
jgi:hypothetical protein